MEATKVKSSHLAIDTTWSWMIAVICGFINFLTFGILRNCGLFFISIISEFNVTREAASLPYSLCYSIVNILGPFAAVVLRYIDATTAMLIGGILASFGMLFGYLATNVYHLALTLGVMQGIGCGLIFMSSHVLVNRHFVKNRASAAGICFAGNNVGGLVLGPVILALQAEFSFRSALLILGALMLNTVPLSLALRGPSISCNKLKWCCNSRTSERKPLLLKCPSFFEEGYGSVAALKLGKISPLPSFEKKFFAPLVVKAVKERIRTENKRREYEELPHDAKTNSHRLENIQVSKVTNGKMGNIEEDCANKAKNQSESHFKKELRCVRYLMSSPIYLVCCFSSVIHFVVLATVLMICVDVAIDNGMPEERAAYIPPFIAIADLACRLGSGWITDKNFLRRKVIYAVSLATMGLALNVMACFGTPEITLAMAGLYGLACGTAMTITFVIFVEYHGLDNLPTAMGISGFLSGLVALFRPTMIGFFRDTIGSYNGLLLLQGCFLLFSAVLWMFEPWLLKGTLLDKQKKHLQDKASES